MASTDQFRERLLQIMDQKNHWAWPWFSEGRVPLAKLLPHFQREWEVYVRDFPVMLARVLGHRPPESVCSALAANIYEEQTGGISNSKPHPELFLRMMEGCGFSRAQFENVSLPPRAAAYRAFLDRMSWDAPWIRGAAVLTIFVEGSANERSALQAIHSPNPLTPAEIEEKVQRHPLVLHHHVPAWAMELVRVHQRVEGGHRDDAWKAVLEHIVDEQQESVAQALDEALKLWLAFRDEVAEACGISKPG
jgi:pyrroloquinoline-quinone synthase